ncbi:diacylglycerol/lipid kinase family protein [Geminicoccus roseus]|uniref:diacylglycerol/lipid kinase family protein n=1 Tax=Geminicoccus roseus TaxID=404900 RepID=UPI0004059605|nr:diacylglycerol kinase family protein [Geminicoccus roseus]
MALIATQRLDQLRRVLVIHNPTAGGRRAEKVAQLADLLRSTGIEVEVQATTGAGDAERIAREAVASADRPDVVVAAGGDGTVNEVANGLLGSDLPLALMPIGTVNVLARELGLGPSVAETARAIRGGQIGLVWPGLANGRAFLLMAGIGFDAAVVAAVSPALKRRFGQLAYLIAAARLWWNWQPGEQVLEADGVSHRAASAIVARCRLYAGSFVGAHAARLDEPDLHLVLFERGSRLAALGYALALATRQLHRWPGVRHLRILKSQVDGRQMIQIDGDPLQADTLNLSIAPTPLRVVCQGP